MRIYLLCMIGLAAGLAAPCSLAAQKKKHGVYAEAGPGIYLPTQSVTPAVKLYYEREFRLPRKGAVSAWGVRTGVALWPAPFLTLPVSVMAKTGRWYHHAEVQAGMHIAFFGDGGGYVPPVLPLPLLQVGYRYEKPQGGLVLKALVGLEYLVITTNVGVGWAF